MDQPQDIGQEVLRNARYLSARSAALLRASSELQQRSQRLRAWSETMCEEILAYHWLAYRLPPLDDSRE